MGTTKEEDGAKASKTQLMDSKMYKIELGKSEKT